MADPILTADRLPVTRTMAEHPLATRTGIVLLQHLISADVAWRGCTTPQKAMLAELCPPVAEQLLRDGHLLAEQMPSLPADTRQVMRDALHRRGMVDEWGRLTGKAVHAWWYTVGRMVSAEARADDGRARPGGTTGEAT